MRIYQVNSYLRTVHRSSSCFVKPRTQGSFSKEPTLLSNLFVPAKSAEFQLKLAKYPQPLNFS